MGGGGDGRVSMRQKGPHPTGLGADMDKGPFPLTQLKWTLPLIDRIQPTNEGRLEK